LAKIKNPKLFSTYFSVDPASLKRLGVFDPILNVDSRLFMDPLLLRTSAHKEISTDAVRQYERHFAKIIALLKASKAKGDVAWRSAGGFIRSPEIKGTCLGYGAASIQGSAVGRQLTGVILQTAKEVVDLGVEDPDLFASLVLFEEGIGADLISDMTTNVILPNLLEFNKRVLRHIKVKTEPFEIGGQRYSLARNPFSRQITPVILVPVDILRNLPVACDRSEIDDVVSKNRQLRNRVNQHIGDIWQAKTLRDKAKVKSAALSSKSAFLALLEVVKEAKGKPYDLEGDPDGLHAWLRVGVEAAGKYPLKIKNPEAHDLGGITSVASMMVDQFRILIEDKGLWKELWHGRRPRKEKSAQRIFFAVADSYCKFNNLDISPEADSGAGPVDFKFSDGYDAKVLVEIKLSTNPKLLHGYEKQLEAYKKAERSMSAIYLVIDLGNMTRKRKELFALRERMKAQGKPVSEIIIMDGTRKVSASRL
jgi:hypothetical protein